jgi:hypothetical protein
MCRHSVRARDGEGVDQIGPDSAFERNEGLRREHVRVADLRLTSVGGQIYESIRPPKTFDLAQQITARDTRQGVCQGVEVDLKRAAQSLQVITLGG